ncbi:hypothetical protein EUTSA_v10011101mg [Eutrema salsugineum]|uniref:Uncharacterized protein n=1 Tax=Eutrema salsugineum TaxID=72664 RepID=V4LP31_EUTSA|nr:inhibitor of trypsin and hageman factor [Eutrema salsugineum]ESQ45529.1 hypothetical protein EUTSA_v10011101mg [Eutrema salsugineum]
MNGICPIIDLKCEFCDCCGISCQSRFPGMKVVWPELKGVSGPVAKRIIEHDNPHVTCVIITENTGVIQVCCCNRVILVVPVANCPNGLVLNSPQIG